MHDNGNLDRRNITFTQAEGIEPLPTQMRPKTMTQELRVKLWLVVENFMSKAMTGAGHLNSEWQGVMFDWHINILHRFSDEFAHGYYNQLGIAKSTISNGDYGKVFKFIEFIARRLKEPCDYAENINMMLGDCRAPYRLIELSIIPITNEAEALSVMNAFNSLRHGNYSGAMAHLTKAGQYLNEGAWADSIRESVHAVEATATKIETAANVLGPALARLEKGGRINPNMKRGFNALYDYTSDEKGIRHSLLDEGQANVGEAEALYMFGACASFITYLTRKAEQTG